MKGNELKPCPFCGGEAELSSDYSSERGKTRWSVWHECCEHEGESAGYGHALFPWFETPWYDTEAEAIAAWNARIERTCKVIENSRKYVLSDGTELFDDGCSVCNGYIGDGENYCANCGAKVVR